MEKHTPKLSVIVPLFNEASRLSGIKEIIDYLKRNNESWELILVDDGSVDGTGEIIKKYINKQIKILSYEKNKGKGYAIKRGMLEARGDYRLFIDVDLSTPITEIEKFTPFLKKYDCIIGTRKAGGAVVKVHQSWIRETMGKTFTIISQIILNTKVSDFTCGFKCFSAKCANDIFKLSRIERWGFDSEILFLCKRLHYSIKEIPITWSDDSRTRVRFPQDIMRSLFDLIKIRYYETTGQYS